MASARLRRHRQRLAPRRQPGSVRSVHAAPSRRRRCAALADRPPQIGIVVDREPRPARATSTSRTSISAPPAGFRRGRHRLLSVRRLELLQLSELFRRSLRIGRRVHEPQDQNPDGTVGLRTRCCMRSATRSGSRHPTEVVTDIAADPAVVHDQVLSGQTIPTYHHGERWADTGGGAARDTGGPLDDRRPPPTSMGASGTGGVYTVFRKRRELGIGLVVERHHANARPRPRVACSARRSTARRWTTLSSEASGER